MKGVDVLELEFEILIQQKWLNLCVHTLLLANISTLTASPRLFMTRWRSVQLNNELFSANQPVHAAALQTKYSASFCSQTCQLFLWFYLESVEGWLESCGSWSHWLNNSTINNSKQCWCLRSVVDLFFQCTTVAELAACWVMFDGTTILANSQLKMQKGRFYVKLHPSD